MYSVGLDLDNNAKGGRASVDAFGDGAALGSRASRHVGLKAILRHIHTGQYSAVHEIVERMDAVDGRCHHTFFLAFALKSIFLFLPNPCDYIGKLLALHKTSFPRHPIMSPSMSLTISEALCTV